MKAKSVKMVVVLLAAFVIAALAVPASASVVPATQIKSIQLSPRNSPRGHTYYRRGSIIKELGGDR